MQLIRDGIVEAFWLLLKLDPLVMGAAFRSIWISLFAVLLAAIAGITIGSLLAREKFYGRNVLVILFRAGMSVPTVLIGLVCLAMFSRRGPLGSMELLYTPWAIVLGEFFLALPIIVSWTHRAISSLDPRIPETAMTLGAKPLRRWLTYLSEMRLEIILALLTAFSRCFTELGIALMVGGNIKYRTRTLPTATALETAQGEFARGFAMSLILLLIAILLTVCISMLHRPERES